MNPKGFFKEPFMNAHGSIKNPKWFFAAPNLWLEEPFRVLSKNPMLGFLKGFFTKNPPKGFFVAPFGGASIGTAQRTLKGATWHLYF